MSNTNIPFDYPTECTVIALDDINQDDRGRSEYGDLQELADSIQNFGLIHSPTLTKSGNVLIAGGRRIAAMKLLGCTHIPVTFREELEPHQITELELEENLKRLGMKWHEKVLMIYKMHNQKVLAGVKMRDDWKQSDTSKLLGVSAGHVSHALYVAELMLNGDTELAECESLPKAWNVILGRREQEAMAAVAARSGAVPLPVADTGGPVIVDLDDAKTTIIQNGDSTDDIGMNIDPVVVIPPSVQGTTIHKVKLDDMFMLGDCIEVMKKLPAGCVDHVVTDIPYGIDMKNLDSNRDIDTVVDTHDVEQNVDMMPKFLTAAYKVVKAGGFVVFWYDLDHHEKLLGWAKDAGFSPQRWPIAWVKTHPCRNSTATKNFTKAIEYAMVLRKSTESNLHSPAPKNYVIADGSAERKLYDNPFAKPFEVWKFILEHIAFKGQVILDPFAGQLSCPRACINLGMIPRAIELDPYHLYHGLGMIKELYTEMTQGNIEFIGDPTPSLAQAIAAKQDTQPSINE